MRAVLHTGDAREVLAGMVSESVHCVVTSPPYFGLRDYGVAGQIGLEARPDCLGWATGDRCAECFVCAMVGVFAEVKRVLRADGTLWLNLGDSYTAGKPRLQQDCEAGGMRYSNRPSFRRDRLPRQDVPHTGVSGLAPKNLIGVPWRVAMALQAGGWTLRSEITWCKKSAMPESIADRPTSATEKVFLLARSERYYFDGEAVREPAVSGHGSGNGFNRPQRISVAPGSERSWDWHPEKGRNMRNYWELGPEPFPEAHFATFVSEVPRRAIAAGTSERGCCPACLAPYRRQVEPTPEYAALLGKDWADYERDAAEGRGHFALDGGNGHAAQRCVKRGVPSVTAAYVTTGWQAGCACDAGEAIPATVLDPFGGAGTTAVVAGKLGRDAVLVELNPEYVAMSERRILDEVGPLLATVEVR